MPENDGRYFGGGFQVPAVPGLYSVTGLPFKTGAPFFKPGCQGVIFFGSNQQTEDAVVSAVYGGSFQGFMAEDNTTAILTQANSVIPGIGSSARGYQPIYQILSFSPVVVDYSANAVSLNNDGFTVNFVNVPASGTRWIHWLAWGDFDHSDSYRPPKSSSLTATLGWQAGASFNAGTYSPAGDGTGDSFGLQYEFAWWGGATYDREEPGEFAATYSSICGIQAGGMGGGLWHNRLLVSAPTTATNFGFGYVGPFLGENLHHGYPTGVGELDFYMDCPGLDNSTLFAMWDGDGDNGKGTPGVAFGDTVEQSLSPITTADAILFWGACGQDGFAGSEYNGPANGYGVAVPPTPDYPGYQGCVMVNNPGYASFAPPNYVFQSRTKSWCANVDAAGASAGTTDMPDDGGLFTWTTDDDDIAPQALAWCAYGHGGFVPQIYRRIPILHRESVLL